MRIYVDMDDTIADFASAYKKAIAANPDIKYPQSQHGFFRDLEPIYCAPQMAQALAHLGHDVWILTRPSTLNRLCYTEKADWIYKHMGQDWVDKLILCPDKALLKGDYLIDDILWPGFEGKQLLYGSEDYPSWNDVYEYFVITYGR